MRQLKLLGLALMAILSLSIASTSVGQAAELKGLPEKAKFTFKSIGKTTLETLAGKKIECSGVTGAGEFTSDRLGNVEFKFTGCEFKLLAVKCTGLSDTTAGNITVSAEFHIRHLLPASEGVNIAVLLTSPVHFNCSVVLFVVLGCVSSMDILTASGGSNAVNTLLSSMFVSFLQATGDQKPNTIDTDSGLAMESCELGSKEGTGTEESAGQLGEGTLENFKNTKGEAVTGLIDLTGTF